MSLKTGKCESCRHGFHLFKCTVRVKGPADTKDLCPCESRGYTPQDLLEAPFLDELSVAGLGQTMVWTVMSDMIRRVGKMERERRR